MDPSDFYLLPFVGCFVAVVFAFRLNPDVERRSIGGLILIGGLFGCFGYWMNLAINGSYFVLMSFLFPMLVAVGLAHLCFPEPPFRGAPLNKLSKGGNVVSGIGIFVAVIAGGLLNFYLPAREFLIQAYFDLGMPS